MKKSVLIAITVVVALAIVAYVFLSGTPEGPEAPAETAPEKAASEQAGAGGSTEVQTARAVRQNGSSAAQSVEERPPEWESETRGDLISFSLTHGEIGYVDVNSVLQDRDPFSVVDLLQAHRNLTGADESLEITIDRIRENEIWGHEVLFAQLIEGQPTNEKGMLFFSSSGAVTRVFGEIINPQALSSGGLLILSPEAETIAREAAARYAATLEPENPEWRGLPVTITVYPAEIGYELDSEYAMARIWRVPVSIDGPAGDSLSVSVSPVTGEVIGIKSVVSQSCAGDDIELILCDTV